MFWTVVCALPISYVMVWYIMKWRRGRCNSNADLTGKTVIITGANQGIGYHTALDAATRNARVILACRDVERGEEARRSIIAATDNPRISVAELDLSSLASVRRFAEQVVKKEDRLDVLVNNAGVSGLPKIMTEDGLETQFATNHFGPFLLTRLLLDLLKKSAPSRIINVSSIAHKWCFNFDLDNMCAEKHFYPGAIYFNSKLANVLHAKELSRRLEGTGVSVYSLHPGSINTQLLRSLPAPAKAFMKLIGFLFFRTPEEGAQTSIYCMVEDNLPSGAYFSECAVQEASAEAMDEELAAKLWAKSEKLVGIAK